MQPMDMKPLIPERPTTFPTPAQYAAQGQAGEVNKHGKRGPGAPELGEHHDGNFGVYMAHKKAKLHENFAARYSETDPGTARIFSSVSVYVNGYTAPSLEELKAIIGKGGGKVEHYLSATAVTHVVAQNLPDSKVKEIQAKLKLRHQMPVVYPSWIVDSAKAGRLLPVADYLLPQFKSSNVGITSFMGPSVRTGPGADVSGVVGKVEPQAEIGTGAGAEDDRNKAAGENDSEDLPDLQPVRPEEEELSYMDVEGQGQGQGLHSAAGPSARMDTDIQRYGPQSRLDGYAVPPQQQQAEQESTPTEVGGSSWNGKPGGPSNLVRSAGNDPNFMAGYFNSSRLHFIGGWRSHVQHLVAKESGAGAGVGPDKEPLAGHGALATGHNSSSHTSTTGTADSLPHEEDSDTAGRQGAGAAVAGPGARQAGGAPRSSPFRVIVHVDIDCFFAQVALLDKPHLRDKPVAVAHAGGRPSGTSYTVKAFGDGMDTSKVQPQFEDTEGVMQGLPPPPQPPTALSSSHARGTGASDHGPTAAARGNLTTSFGEISSANYPARAFSIYAGMSVGGALQLCPNLVLLPYAFDKIAAISEAVYRHFMAVTPHVQAMSCDEAFLDLTGDPSPIETISKLRADIFHSTGCTVSAGIGPNMLLAKLATGKAKPNGQYAIGQDTATIQAFMSSLKVGSLPGVGWSTGQRLAEAGVTTVGQLLKVPESQLQAWFGPKTGSALYKAARGIDDRPVVVRKVRKSVGAEVNWGVRFSEISQCHAFLKQLGTEVARRMQQAGTEFAAMFPEQANKAVESNDGVPPPVRAKQLTYKMMVRRPDAPQVVKFLGHGICDTVNRTVHLPVPTSDGDVIAQHAIQAYESFAVDVKDVRGVGIQMSGLLWTDGRRLEDVVGTGSAGQGTASAGTKSMLQYITSKPRARSPPRQPAGEAGTGTGGDNRGSGHAAGQVQPEGLVIEILDDEEDEEEAGQEQEDTAGMSTEGPPMREPGLPSQPSLPSSRTELMHGDQLHAFAATEDDVQSDDDDDDDDDDVVEVPEASRAHAVVLQQNLGQRRAGATGAGAGIQEMSGAGYSRASAASSTQGSASGLGYSTGVHARGNAGPVQSKITFGVPQAASVPLLQAQGGAGAGTAQSSPARTAARKDKGAAAHRKVPKPSTTFMTGYVLPAAGASHEAATTAVQARHIAAAGRQPKHVMQPLLAAEETDDDIIEAEDAAAEELSAEEVDEQNGEEEEGMPGAPTEGGHARHAQQQHDLSVVQVTEGTRSSPAKNQTKMSHGLHVAPELLSHIDAGYLRALPADVQQEVLALEARKAGRKKEGLKLMVAGTGDGRRGALAAMIHSGAAPEIGGGRAGPLVTEASNHPSQQGTQPGVYSPSFCFPSGVHRPDGSLDSTVLIPVLHTWLLEAAGPHPSPQQASLLCAVALDCVLDRRLEDALTVHAALQAAVADIQAEQLETSEELPSRRCWLRTCACASSAPPSVCVATWGDALHAVQEKIQGAVLSAYGCRLADAAFC